MTLIYYNDELLGYETLDMPDNLRERLLNRGYTLIEKDTSEPCPLCEGRGWK